MKADHEAGAGTPSTIADAGGADTTTAPSAAHVKTQTATSRDHRPAPIGIAMSCPRSADYASPLLER
jgi:hypothetical protein